MFDTHKKGYVIKILVLCAKALTVVFPSFFPGSMNRTCDSFVLWGDHPRLSLVRQLMEAVGSELGDWDAHKG